MVRREKSVAAPVESTVTAAQARARVNRFLLSQVGSQFAAGDPELDMVDELWRVPILLVTPGFIAGQVGEAVVSLNTRALLSHTGPKQIHAAAAKLRKRHHAAIKTAFLRARKG
jgi:hypothetical protein